MKPLLISLILCTFLISCATYPKGYVSEKQYHDELTVYTCNDLRMIEIEDLANLETLRNSKLYKKNLALKPIKGAIYAIFAAILLAPVPGDRPNLFKTLPHVSNIDDEIDNIKIELRMVRILSKEKNCPKEYNYEIISNKSHSSHFPH